MKKKDRTASLFGDQQGLEQPGPDQAKRIVRLAFDTGLDGEFDYAARPDDWPIEVGMRLEAPFGRGNRPAVGFCVASDISAQRSFSGRLKYISKVLDDRPLLGAELIELGRWISSYYVCPLGQVLAAMVPGAVKKGAGQRQNRYVYLNHKPEKLPKSAKQRAIIDALVRLQAATETSAVVIDQLLAQANCKTDGPVKRLAETGIVAMVKKRALATLPEAPQGLVVDSGKEIRLNDQQAQALDKITQAIDSSRFGVTVLHGVTDSGKTEVYMRAIEKVVAAGKQAIVLLPEIALTAQTVGRFAGRFERVAVLHSQLTASQRNAQWQMIRDQQADVVIGARSAIFSPLARLALVVVDEEHEPSYKQDTVPRYNGRDVAIKRAQIAGGHCILGSATPSLESLLNCHKRPHFQLLKLTRRVMDLPMPAMKLVDMRNDPHTNAGRRLLSEKLRMRLTHTLAAGEQAILLLNRRGYSNFVFCSSCKYGLRCRNCDNALTYHKRPGKGRDVVTVTGRHRLGGYVVCHYCLAKSLVPEKCPLCGKAMIMIGIGSQRLEEELRKTFPDARIARIDSDSMAGADYYKTLRDFSLGNLDILTGTQMLAKGLHFPNVTLVGIVSADTSLYVPDFRANERTFQLISQVAGRTGRSEKKGRVIVQTFLPEQPAIQYAVKHDFDGFVKAELAIRKGCNLPPFWRMAAILVRGLDHAKVQTCCDKIAGHINAIINQDNLKATVRGPMDAAIARMNRQYRMHIIVEAADAPVTAQLFARLRNSQALKDSSTNVQIDIDPATLL